MNKTRVVAALWILLSAGIAWAEGSISSEVSLQVAPTEKFQENLKDTRDALVNASVAYENVKRSRSLYGDDSGYTQADEERYRQDVVDRSSELHEAINKQRDEAIDEVNNTAEVSRAAQNRLDEAEKNELKGKEAEKNIVAMHRICNQVDYDLAKVNVVNGVEVDAAIIECKTKLSEKLNQTKLDKEKAQIDLKDNIEATKIKRKYFDDLAATLAKQRADDLKSTPRRRDPSYYN